MTSSTRNSGSGQRSALLSIYLIASRLLAVLAPVILRRRLLAGKEHPDRWREKLGYPTQDRPEGRLLWVHAVSVGESLSILPLLKRILDDEPEMSILVTSTTLTSAKLMSERLPHRCIPQFLPLDTGSAIARFLDHWQPEAALLIESELWPRLIHDTHARGIPIMLVNARMSEKSAKRWERFRSFASALLGRIDVITAPDTNSRDKLVRLGVSANRVQIVGSLKGGAEPLPVDPGEAARLSGILGLRPRWLAASTHPGEEDVVIAAQKAAVQTIPDLLLVLAPRHPERADGLRKQMEDAGMSVAQRSKGEDLRHETQCYLADTLGEMGLWYELCPIAFIGGSIVDKGGHNAYEPAVHGSVILHGPHVGNFADLYGRLRDAEGAILVQEPDEMLEQLVRLQDEKPRLDIAKAARTVVDAEQDATGKTTALIRTLIGQK